MGCCASIAEPAPSTNDASNKVDMPRTANRPNNAVVERGIQEAPNKASPSKAKVTDTVVRSAEKKTNSSTTTTASPSIPVVVDIKKVMVGIRDSLDVLPATDRRLASFGPPPPPDDGWRSASAASPPPAWHVMAMPAVRSADSNQCDTDDTLATDPELQPSFDIFSYARLPPLSSSGAGAENDDMWRALLNVISVTPPPIYEEERQQEEAPRHGEADDALDPVLWADPSAAAEEVRAMFAVRVSHEERRNRVSSADSSHQRAPVLEPSHTAQNEHSDPFEADEEDCRRMLTASRAVREFIESAPRWTATKIGIASVQCPSGVADDDEFISESRRLMQIALPHVALALDEARKRDDLTASSHAKLLAIHSGCRAFDYFVRHRNHLHDGLHLHAALLVLLTERLEFLGRLALQREWILSLGRLLRSPEVRRLLSRAVYEKQQRAVKERLENALEARRQSSRLAAAAQKKEWDVERIRLSVCEDQNQLTVNRKLACCADTPRHAVLQTFAIKTAAEIDPAPREKHDSMGPSRRRRAALKKQQLCMEAETRSREAIIIEQSHRVTVLAAPFTRLLPVGGWTIVDARNAADLVDARVKLSRVARRIEETKVISGTIGVGAAGRRTSADDDLRLALIASECGFMANECRTLITNEEEQARLLLMRSWDASYDLAAAHDARREAMRLCQWREQEVQRRRSAALVLLHAVMKGHIVRHRLSGVNRIKPEARALCTGADRNAKQIVQVEMITRADIMQFFECTAPCPTPGKKTIPSPQCVPTVEAIYRESISADEAVARETLLRWECNDAHIQNNLPSYLVGKRVWAATVLQAGWRGLQLRRHFAKNMRDQLTLERMKRLQRRFGVRALQESEHLERLRIEDAENEADLFGTTQEGSRRRVAQRHRATALLQRWWRGAVWRKYRLPALIEAYWKQRLRRTTAMQLRRHM